jgi:hypothetical protein
LAEAVESREETEDIDMALQESGGASGLRRGVRKLGGGEDEEVL